MDLGNPLAACMQVSAEVVAQNDIVIKIGSANVRFAVVLTSTCSDLCSPQILVGRASDGLPITVRNVIARLRTTGVDAEADCDSRGERDNALIEAMRHEAWPQVDAEIRFRRVQSFI